MSRSTMSTMKQYKEYIKNLNRKLFENKHNNLREKPLTAGNTKDSLNIFVCIARKFIPYIHFTNSSDEFAIGQDSDRN